MSFDHVIENIDDYLGDGEHRFFGMGYRRVSYEIENISVSFKKKQGDEHKLTADLSVTYPVDWSKKKSGNLTPHLSSVDVIILTARFCEVMLSQCYLYSPSENARTWIKNIKLKAGTSAQEDLENIPVVMKMKTTSGDKENEEVLSSVFECKIGKMLARCEVEHLNKDAAYQDTVYPSLSTLFDAPQKKYYGDLFKVRGQRLTNIRYDRATQQVISEVKLTIPDGNQPTVGIEGAWQPMVTFVDCFVSHLQLSQILMYELDNIARADSETLWMLQTEISASSPARNVADTANMVATVTAAQLFNIDSLRWRQVSTEGEYAGIKIKCSLSHLLPINS
ncbi:AvrD [Serratia sp. FGI94]|uniref:AvrD family protein n=1 Tax=Serratia sp. FGI94 TaxID=671990 RepID=UPI0002A71D8B|nr:AvrD family protein [Serratia sp. FGI94]AGB83998.1 AvrD [Serratia sp. FGI94]